jgi:hypothetical protein
MLRWPLLAFRGFALLVGVLALACSSFDGSKCCEIPPDASGSGGCDSARFTACVHACGETDSSEATAASCANGVYSCSGSTVPAVSCPQSGWAATLPCGPWVSGYDCGSQCALCEQGLWTCGPCADAAAP